MSSIFNKLPVYREMVQVNETKDCGFGKAFFSRTFRSGAKFQDVKNFYSDYLGKEGWKVTTERTLSNFGQDLGGGLIVYRRDEYEISIEYSGEKANYEWQYGIGVGWRGKK